MDNKEKAIQYARAGFRLIPLWWIDENGKCACGDSECGNAASRNNPGKHPLQKLVKDGRDNSTNDVEIIGKWWSKYPKANIGLDCSRSGVFVVDIDIHTDKKGVTQNGFESLEDLETTFKEKFNCAVSAETGGGGLHIFYKAPKDFTSCPAGFGRNFPGIDIKFNGYVLLSPSNHKSGASYRWSNDEAERDFILNKIPDLPKSIEKYVRDGYDENRTSPARYTSTVRPIDSDDENQILEALEYLDFWSLDDDERLKVGMGLQSALPGNKGKEYYFDWLQRSLGSKFNRRFSERRWRSFKVRSGGRTIASFFELAMQNGWHNEGKKGFYIDPADYVDMEPTLVSEEVKEEKNLFVDFSVQAPMMVDYSVPSEIMIIDYDIEPDYPEIINVDYSAKPDVYIESNSEFLGELMSIDLDDDSEYQELDPELLAKWLEMLGDYRVAKSLFMWQAENSSAFVPEISLSFTVSVLGALCAGRFAHRKLTTNTYFTVVAETSVGKTQTMKLAKEVLAAANDHSRIGPDDIISDKGFVNDLVKDPARYFLLDEIGELFLNIFDEKANSSQKMIKKVLLSSYTAFGSDFNNTASRADNKNAPAVNLGSICPSIFGLTTPAVIFKSMSSKDIIDGMLSRMMLLVSDAGIQEGRNPKNSPLPQVVGEWLHKLKSAHMYSTGAIMPVDGQSQSVEMNCSEEAEILKKKIKKLETQKRIENGEYGGIYGRLCENVIRVAIALEISENPYSRMISDKAMLTAFNIISFCLDQSVRVAKSYIHDSKEEMAESDILRCLSNCKQGATLKDVRKRISGVSDYGKANMIISNMVRDGSVLEFRVKTSGRGRPSIIYFHPLVYQYLPESEKAKFEQKPKIS